MGKQKHNVQKPRYHSNTDREIRANESVSGADGCKDTEWSRGQILFLCMQPKKIP